MGNGKLATVAAGVDVGLGVAMAGEGIALLLNGAIWQALIGFAVAMGCFIMAAMWLEGAPEEASE